MKHFYRNKLLINFIFVILLTSMTAIISFKILDKIIPLDTDGRFPIFISMILAGAAISSIVSFVLTERYINPLNELVSKSQQLADNNGDIQLSFDNEDVSDILNNTIDYLILSVKKRDADIEELRRQIHESKRLSALGELAAGVAHEINNPLGGITVYSNLLLEDTPQDDSNYSNIKKIIRESERCKNIVKSLLTFARQGQPKLEKADLNKIITEALSNLRSEEIFENIHVIEKFGENLPDAFVDISQIQEVFENVIRNAAEIMEISGDLTIISSAVSENGNDGMLCIQFEDTGPGISDEHLKSIFDPFFTTKKKGHGTGLGLALSYGIIERHGGTLTARNSPGGGAEFTVRLPVFKKSEEKEITEA
ncbi:sensor histidine kinase [Candidatus Latescibacterota bacterium]